MNDNQINTDWAEQELKRLRKQIEDMNAAGSGITQGCICPPGANLSCASPFCPRKCPNGYHQI